jgi:prepilin-type N-terminal cleavage/methylation domain-containing protein
MQQHLATNWRQPIWTAESRPKGGGPKARINCKQSRWRQSGFGLLEILLAIAVAAIIAIISVGYYTNVRSEQKVNEFINQLVTLGHNVASYVNTNANTPGNQDLTKIFGTGTTNVAQTLIDKNITQVDTVTNIWQPPSLYFVYVAINGPMKSISCLRISVEVPGMLVNQRSNFCSMVANKATQALQHAPQNDVIVNCGSGGDIEVNYCAE